MFVLGLVISQSLDCILLAYEVQLDDVVAVGVVVRNVCSTLTNFSGYCCINPCPAPLSIIEKMPIIMLYPFILFVIQSSC